MVMGADLRLAKARMDCCLEQCGVEPDPQQTGRSGMRGWAVLALRALWLLVL